MAKLLILIGMLASSAVYADCTVKSVNDPELTRGLNLNKDTICSETLFSVTGSYAGHEAYSIVITTGDRGMYYVRLPKIIVSHPDLGTAYYSGTLHWNPDGSDVVLD